jgi:hypothetical protein
MFKNKKKEITGFKYILDIRFEANGKYSATPEIKEYAGGSSIIHHLIFKEILKDQLEITEKYIKNEFSGNQNNVNLEDKAIKNYTG